MNDILPPEGRINIVEYTKTEAALTLLRERFTGIVFHTTPEGMKAAREGRRELVTLRTSLDKLRMDLNEGDAARIKARNTRAKEIAAEILALEEPIDNFIKAEERKKEEERAAKAAIEAARVKALHDQLAKIHSIPATMINKPSEEIATRLAQLKEAQYEGEEMQATLDDAKHHAIITLTAMFEQARDAEAARKASLEAEAREAEEREKTRKAEEEMLAEARQRQEAEEAAHREKMRLEAEEHERKLAAERAVEEKARAEREALEAKAREAREAEEAKARAERDRVAAEQAAESKRLAEAQRELQQRELELIDASNMLILFKSRFGALPRFKAIIAAIDAYMLSEEARAAAKRGKK